ncbi:hypothetical protein [Dipodfec virus UOA04_Rod_720]|nr:hypothetical protein [Dipodfec virus UOA04_Rod_720]
MKNLQSPKIVGSLLLVLFALFLIGFVIIARSESCQNDFSCPSSESKEAASTFTVSYGTAPCPNLFSQSVGDTDLSAIDRLKVPNSCLMLRSIFPKLLNGTTSLSSSFRPDLVKATSSVPIGYVGTIPPTAIYLFTIVSVSILLFMLFLVIIGIKFLRMMKFVVLKLCFPTIVDPSRRFSAGSGSLMVDDIRRLEKNCFRALSIGAFPER